MNIPSMQAVNTAYFRSLAAAEQPDPVLGGTKATDDAVVIQAKPAPAQQPPAAAPAAEKQPKTLPGRFARWLNVMSLPQPSTEGNFDGPAWFQAGFQSAVEGFYLGGLAGSLGALSASMSGVFVGYKTGKQLLSVATGAATGAGILAALAHAGGPAAMATAGITGGLLGAYATYRGNCLSRVRDSAGNASMLAGPFFHGTGKVAAGLGAATAVHFTSNKKAQMAIGAAVGASIGLALGAAGYSPLGPVAGAVVAGLAGGIGTQFGPRYSQFFRNTTSKFGDGVETAGMKLGVVHDPMSRRTKNIIGTLPSSFIKEGFRGAILADLNPTAFFLGGICETIQQIDIFWNQKDSEGAGAQPAPPPSTGPNPQP